MPGGLLLVRTTGFRFKNGTEIPAQTLCSPHELKGLLEPICGMRKAGETNPAELMLFARTFESNGVSFARFSPEVQDAILEGRIYSAMVEPADGKQKVPVILYKTLRGGYMELDHAPNGQSADLAPGFFLVTSPECVRIRGSVRVFTSTTDPRNIFE